MKDQLNPVPEPDRPSPKLPSLADLAKEFMEDKRSKMGALWTTDPNNTMLKVAAKNIFAGPDKPLLAGDLVLSHKGMSIVLGPYAKPFVRTGAELVSFPNYGLTMDTEIAILGEDSDPTDPNVEVPILIAPSVVLIPVHEAVSIRVPEKVKLLKEVEKIYNARYKFAPKMQVRWKKRLCTRKMKGVFTYVGKLTKKIPMAGEREDSDEVDSEILDCTILCTLNSCPVTFIVDSRYLEPAEG
jgi:hypothetical protein